MWQKDSEESTCSTALARNLKGVMDVMMPANGSGEWLDYTGLLFHGCPATAKHGLNQQYNLATRDDHA